MPLDAPAAFRRLNDQDPRALGELRVTGRRRHDVGQLSHHPELLGVPSDRTSAIATATLAGMEGALILCRAEGNNGPLETVAAELMRLLPPDAAATA